MIYLRNFYYLTFILLFTSCLYDVIEKVETDNLEKYDSDVIISSSNHIAFPDIIHYQNTWYVSYRESDTHGTGSFSKTIILKSSDLKSWERCNSFEMDEWDLRGGQFSLNEEKDDLSFLISIKSVNSSERKHLYTKFNSKNKEFNPFLFQLKPDPKFPNDFFYYPFWYKGKMYISANDRTGARFYKYDGLESTPIIFSEISGSYPGQVTEADIYIYKDTVYTLVRRVEGGLLGKLPITADSVSSLGKSTKTPFKTEVFKNFAAIGGPELLIHNDTIYIGGRDDVTRLSPIYKYSLNSKNLVLAKHLSVWGYDTSYPRMFLKDDTIYGVYYTQSQNLRRFEIRLFKIEV